MENKKFRRCIYCGMPIIIIAGILYESSPICKDCLAHKQDHLPESGFAHELLGLSASSASITASPSSAPSTLEDEIQK